MSSRVSKSNSFNLNSMFGLGTQQNVLTWITWVAYKLCSAEERDRERGRRSCLHIHIHRLTAILTHTQPKVMFVVISMMTTINTQITRSEFKTPVTGIESLPDRLSAHIMYNVCWLCQKRGAVAQKRPTLTSGQRLKSNVEGIKGQYRWLWLRFHSNS